MSRTFYGVLRNVPALCGAFACPSIDSLNPLHQNGILKSSSYPSNEAETLNTFIKMSLMNSYFGPNTTITNFGL
jgi:hypothetical protein